MLKGKYSFLLINMEISLGNCFCGLGEVQAINLQLQVIVTPEQGAGTEPQQTKGVQVEAATNKTSRQFSQPWCLECFRECPGK